MKALIDLLRGRKTIIGTVILGIIGVLVASGVLSAGNVWVQVISIVVATLTGVSARLAITKLQNELLKG